MASVFFTLPLAALSPTAPATVESTVTPQSPRASLTAEQALDLIGQDQFDQVAPQLGSFATTDFTRMPTLDRTVIKEFFYRSSFVPHAVQLQNIALSALERSSFPTTVGSDMYALTLAGPILESLIRAENAQGILRFTNLLPETLKEHEFLKGPIPHTVKYLLNYNDQETAQALITAFNLPPLPSIHEEVLPLGQEMTIQFPEIADGIRTQRCVTKGLEIVADDKNTITVRAIQPGHHAVFIQDLGPFTSSYDNIKIRTPQ